MVLKRSAVIVREQEDSLNVIFIRQKKEKNTFFLSFCRFVMTRCRCRDVYGEAAAFS